MSTNDIIKELNNLKNDISKDDISFNLDKRNQNKALDTAIDAITFQDKVKDIVSNIYSSAEDKYVDLCSLINESD